MSTSILPAGARAPEFALASTPSERVSLGDFRGRPVILAFYPADWSPVCGDQMALYNEIIADVPRIQRRSARHLGRRRVVSPGVRRGAAVCAFRCSRTSSRRARSRVSTVPTTRRRRRAARAVRHRRRRRDRAGAISRPLDVNPGRRRHSRRARSAERTEGLVMASLRIPVGAADHAQGAADAPVTLVEYGDYRMPALRRGVSDRAAVCSSRFGRGSALRLPQLSAHRDRIPNAVNAADHGRVRCGATSASGRCTTRSSRTSRRSASQLYDSIAAELGLDVDALHAALGRSSTSRSPCATSSAACGAASTARRRSSSTASATKVRPISPRSKRRLQGRFAQREEPIRRVVFALAGGTVINPDADEAIPWFNSSAAN